MITEVTEIHLSTAAFRKNDGAIFSANLASFAASFRGG